MRKQYHFRPSENGYYAWDVDRLAELTKNFDTVEVRIDSIRELDEAFWFGDPGNPPTCRTIAEHADLILEADLSFPIILSTDGSVMDGMHRVCRALIEGLATVSAVKFDVDPKPDYVDIYPDDLPY